MATTAKKQYAAGTKVSVARSREQVDAELRLLGAQHRAIGDDDVRHQAVVLFDLEGVRYRIILPLPDLTNRKYSYDSIGRWLNRTDPQKSAAWEQDCAERWRALAEYIKMVRVSKEAGIITLQEALLAHALLPNGQTVGEYTLPQLPEVYARGEMPPLLPGMDGGGPRLLRAPDGQG